MGSRIREHAATLLEQGGPIALVILGVSLVGWAILFRLFLARAREEPRGTTNALRARLALQDEWERDRGSLRLVALLASAAPLLGLLGTVLGMMETFSFLGESDLPRVDALAGGVSRALLTTQAGLIAALTLLVGHMLLERLLQRRARAAGILT